MSTTANILSRSGKASAAGLSSCLAAIAAFLLLIGWSASSGIRGSDQYWYVADVESLVTGKGVQTNEVYPTALEVEAELPRPFIHNILPVYVVALPAVVTGPFVGWIVTNVLATLLAGFFIFLTASRFVDTRSAALGAGFYLALPLTFWLTAQALAEPVVSLLVAVACYVFVVADRRFQRWLLLLTVVGLLYYSRSSFLPLLALAPLGYWASTSSGDQNRWLCIGGLLGLSVVIWALKPALFPSYLSLSQIEVINGVVAGHSPGDNMSHYFEAPTSTIQASVLVNKAIHAARFQFASFDVSGLLFVWPFNLLMLVPFLLARTAKSGLGNPVVITGILLIFLHVLTIVLAQNQFRYSLVAMPPLAVGLTVLLGQRGWLNRSRNFWLICSAVVAFALPIDFALARYARSEALIERQIRATVEEMVDERIPSDAPVLIDFDQQTPLLVGYVLRPRPVLYLLPRLEPDAVRSMRDEIGAKWLIAPPDSPLIQEFESNLVGLVAESGPQELALYQLRSPDSDGSP